MLLSIVIPVHNEAACIPILVPRLRSVLHNMDCAYELIFVNDGSTDKTADLLETLTGMDSRIRVIGFTRNFGHQAAITAGLDFATGDAVITMDADLQDPPELIPEMFGLFQSGYHLVSAQRQSRPGDGAFKRLTATMFYWSMRRFVDKRLQPEVGDFRLFSRPAVLALRQFREQHRFIRGLVAWLGLKEIILPFERQPRIAGETKYPLRKMLQFAWTAISSFSAIPLQAVSAIGALTIVFGFAYLAFTLFSAIVTHTVVPGWTSLVCLQVIFSGTILMALGVVGNYVARIYEESKRRPLYVVSDVQHSYPRGDSNGLPERGLIVEQCEMGEIQKRSKSAISFPH